MNVIAKKPNHYLDDDGVCLDVSIKMVFAIVFMAMAVFLLSIYVQGKICDSVRVCKYKHRMGYCVNFTETCDGVTAIGKHICAGDGMCCMEEKTNRAKCIEGRFIDGIAIVMAARSQLGVPYTWGGGSYKGKSVGIEYSVRTVGFDSSGLTQYAVYHGVGNKVIARMAADQYVDKKCHHVDYAEHKPGDLVFFNDNGSIHHVAIMSGRDTMIHALQVDDQVLEAWVYTKGRMAQVQRCW